MTRKRMVKGTTMTKTSISSMFLRRNGALFSAIVDPSRPGGVSAWYILCGSSTREPLSSRKTILNTQCLSNRVPIIISLNK